MIDNFFSPRTAIASLTITAVTSLTPVMAEETPTPVIAKDTMQPHLAAGVVFQTPSGFSNVRPLGEDAVGVVYPATATKGSQKFLISMVAFDAETLRFLNMDDQELLGYVKYLFLGVNTPAGEYQDRRFLGQTITGEVQMKRTRRGYNAIEIYLVPLAKGGILAMAFEADTQLPLMQVENTITTVTRSLREATEAEKKAAKKAAKKRRKS